MNKRRSLFSTCLLAALLVTLLLVGCSLQKPKDQHWDAKPSVYIDGVLYGTTGMSVTYRTDDTPENGGRVDGTVTSTVESWEYPAEDDQSNFGTGHAYRFGEDGTVEVFFSKWVIFEAYNDQ